MKNTTEFVNMNDWIGFDEVFIAALTTTDNIEQEPFILHEDTYKENANYEIRMLHEKNGVMHLLFNSNPVIARSELLGKPITQQATYKIYSHAVQLDTLFPNFKGHRYKTNSILSIENSPLVASRYLKYLTDTEFFIDNQNNNPTKKLTFPKSNKKV